MPFAMVAGSDARDLLLFPVVQGCDPRDMVSFAVIAKTHLHRIKRT